MAKSRNLKVSDIQPVEDPIVDETMAELKAEVGTPRVEAKRIDGGNLVLPIEFFNTTVPVERWNTGKMVFGKFVGSKKQYFANEYYEIEAVLNALGGLRVGHYAVVEQGVHLLETFESLKKLYSGRFGYIDFSLASAEWLAKFAEKGIKPLEGRSGYLAVNIDGKNTLAPGFYMDNQNLMTLEHRAEKMGKTVATLSPKTISNHKETWNTYHKRVALDSIVDMVNGDVQIVLHLTEKVQPWQLAQVSNRFNVLFGSPEEVAKELNKSANNGQAQTTVDQDAFIAKQGGKEVLDEMEAKADTLKIAVFGGKTMSARELVRCNVTRMRGDVATIDFFLKDLAASVRQVEYAIANGFTFRVNRRAE